MRSSFTIGSRVRAALVLSCVLALAACSPKPAAPPKPRFNVLLITVDTLRADRVGPRADGTSATPFIDAHLAADGVTFTHAQTPRSKTTPALASLMTGLYPHEHGVRDLMEPLALGVPTLAERLRAAGWRTGAIVGNYVLRDRFSGLARGFEQWTEDLPQTEGVPPEDVPQRTATSMVDGALVALGLANPPATPGAGPARAFTHGDDPWFLWLHFMDPHGRYEPPAEFRASATPRVIDPAPVEGAQRRPFVAQYNVPAEARLEGGRFDAAYVEGLYDGEVRYVDAELARLFAELAKRPGLLENTLVVFTSDHGEAFGEHDVWFEHGQDAYEETARVPLVVSFPAYDVQRPPARRNASDISLCNVAPTILDYFGLWATDGYPTAERGVSRLSTWRLTQSTSSSPVFCERVDRSAGAQYKAVRIGDWKLVRRYARTVHDTGASSTAGSNSSTGSGPPRVISGVALRGEELFDLAVDPREQHALRGAWPPDAPVERLSDALNEFTNVDTRFFDPGAKPRTSATSAEEAEQQRILDRMGYGGGDDPHETAPRPPPPPAKTPPR